MEMTQSDSNHLGVCEKLFVAIRTASPFKPTRRISHHRPQGGEIGSFASPHGGASASSSLAKANIQKQIPVSGHDPTQKNNQKGYVAPKKELVQHISSGKLAQFNLQENIAGEKQEGKVIFVPIHSPDNKKPQANSIGSKKEPSLQVKGELESQKLGRAESVNAQFSQYINTAGKRIRAPTIASQKSSMKRDSFNERVSQYINRAKLKFHSMPSHVDNGIAKTLPLEDSVQK